MLQYRDNNPVLIDCYTEEYHGNFHLQVPENEYAYLLFPDGRRKSYGSGDHLIRLNRYHSLFHGTDRITQYRFDMSAQIAFSMQDLVCLPELMMRYIAPELKLYCPVDVCVNTELSVRISDRSKLLTLLYSCQENDPNAVLDADFLSCFLKSKLHYPLEESLCRHKQAENTDLYHLSLLSEDAEVDLIEQFCSLLDNWGLELVSLRIAQILPSPEGLDAFHKKENEMINLYNQARMDSITAPVRESSSKRRKKTRSDFSPVFSVSGLSACMPVSALPAAAL